MFSSDWLYGVFCANDDCACGTPMLPTRALAIAAWNRRAPTLPPDVAATMREALEYQDAAIRRKMNLWYTDPDEYGRLADQLAAIDAALSWLAAQEGTPLHAPDDVRGAITTLLGYAMIYGGDDSAGTIDIVRNWLAAQEGTK